MEPHKNSAAVKNVVMLYVLNIAKMVVPLLTLPYLTRVLSLDAYATVVLVKSIMVYLTMFVEFGFNLSITKEISVNKDNPQKVSRILSRAFFAQGCLAVVSLLILLPISMIVPIFHENIDYILLSSLAILPTVLFQDYYYRGTNKMQVIALRFLAMRIITTALTFALVKNDQDLLLLPVLDFFGNLFAAIFVRRERIKDGIHLTSVPMIEALHTIKNSLRQFISIFATTAFTALNTLVIGLACTTQDVAYWGVVSQIVSAIQSLLTPFTDGIYPVMMREKNYALIQRVLKILLPVVVIGSVFTYFVSDFAVILIAGEKYKPAASVLRYITPLFPLSLLAILFGWPALGAIHKESEIMKTTIYMSILQCVGLLLLYLMNNLTLPTVCALRIATEFGLFISRYTYIRKYKLLFLGGN